MKKFRISTVGVIISGLSLLPWALHSIDHIHKRSFQVSKKTEKMEIVEEWKKQVAQDINDNTAWQIPLDSNEGLRVGDQLDTVKGGKIGARTVKVIPLTDGKTFPDQIARVDQKTGKVLEIFSTEQIKKVEVK